MNHINAEKYIDQLTAHGEIAFTMQQMSDAMGVTTKAVERATYRLRKKGEIATPAKGYCLILTPEFRKLGCLPPDYFIDELMRHWQQPYYVGLLSAALYFGAAHQQPQIFQIITTRYHPTLHCGHVKIEFITKKTIADIPTQQLKTHTGSMTVSTVETTIMDLMNFMRRSGGISRVATIIDELADSIDSSALDFLLQQSKELSWMQRLGYLLEKLGHSEPASLIYKHIAFRKTNIVPLVPYYSRTGTERNSKWRIAINAVVESDTDDSY